MLLDQQYAFSDAQSVTTSPTVSTNLVDLGPLATGNTGRNVGVGQTIYVVTGVDVALVGASAALVVTLETDDNSSFSSATVAQTLYTIPAVSAAGTVSYAAINPAALNERYARLKYTESGGTITSATLSSYVCLDIDQIAYFARGWSIA